MKQLVPFAGKAFPLWTEKLLWRWRAELDHYQKWWSANRDRLKTVDQPDWHRERTQIGFLALAFRREFPGGVVVEEFCGQPKKHTKKGRGDLWFSLEGAGCYVEAKQADCRVSSRFDIETKMSKAVQDANATKPDWSDAQRWAATVLSLWELADELDRKAPQNLWLRIKAEIGDKKEYAAACWFATNPHPYREKIKGVSHELVSLGAFLIIKKLPPKAGPQAIRTLSR